MREQEKTDRLLARLLAAIGKASLDPFEQLALSDELRKIRDAYSGRRAPPAGYRRLLKRFRANTAKRRALRQQLEPIYSEIRLAGFLQANPDKSALDLREMLHDPDVVEHISHAKIEADEDEDVAAYFDRTGRDYRKDHLREDVIEPFFRLMKAFKIRPSRHRLPRSAMFEALFDFVGVEPRLRPTSISGIAKQLKHKRSPPRR